MDLKDEINRAGGQFGKTPLIEAIRYGHIEIIKLLVSKGADVSKCDTEYGKTPLMWLSDSENAGRFSEEKFFNVAKLILDNGANPNQKQEQGLSNVGVGLSIIDKIFELFWYYRDSYMEDNFSFWVDKFELYMKYGGKTNPSEEYTELVLEWLDQIKLSNGKMTLGKGKQFAPPEAIKKLWRLTGMINESSLMSFLNENTETKSIRLAKRLGVQTGDVFDLVKKIEEKSPNTDVLKFKTIDELREFAEHLKSNVDIKKRGVFDKSAYSKIDLMFENDDFSIYRLKCFDDIRLIGANTNWCITVRDVWFDYKGDYTFYVIINKNLDPNDNAYKICVNVNKKNIAKVWLKDNSKKTISYLRNMNVPDIFKYDEKIAYNKEPGLEDFSKEYVESMNVRVATSILNREPDRTGRIHDINTRTPDGSTVLMAMSYFNKEDLVSKLIKKGAELDLQSDVGNTALILATTQGAEKAVKVLLNAGAKVDLADREGNTPLMYASNYDFPNIVKLLLQFGANKNKKNNDGSTPLDLAKEYNNTEVIRLLEEPINESLDIKYGDYVVFKPNTELSSSSDDSTVSSDGLQWFVDSYDGESINLQSMDNDGKYYCVFADPDDIIQVIRKNKKIWTKGKS
jgi:ankyrin repeat protein